MIDASADPALQASMDHCAGVTRARARNFYFGLKLTPEPKRSALYALYAWTRQADDTVDGAPTLDHARRALDCFREESRLVIEQRFDLENLGRSDPMWLAVRWTLRRYPIDLAWLWAVLDGMEEDLSHAGYEDLAALERYCGLVASTVGKMCVAVWGIAPGTERAQAETLAHQRGIAFQITNILRDLRADRDASPGRVYLPRQVLQQHGVTIDDLCAWSKPDRCSACVRAIAVRARAAYDESEPLHAMIEPECRASLLAMTRIYSGLLGLIERDPSRVCAPVPARLTTARKLTIALSAMWSAQRSARREASIT